VTTAEHRDAIARDIRRRLEPLCADWPPDLFESMVARLADITLKYRGISSSEAYDRRSTDRLVRDLKDALERSRELRGE
jgi:hypothetical protein